MCGVACHFRSLRFLASPPPPSIFAEELVTVSRSARSARVSLLSLLIASLKLFTRRRQKRLMMMIELPRVHVCVFYADTGAELSRESETHSPGRVSISSAEESREAQTQRKFCS